MLKKLKYILYRINSLETRLSELESFVSNSISSPSHVDIINFGEKKSLVGNWKRLDNFSRYKRSRGMLSDGDIYWV